MGLFDLLLLVVLLPWKPPHQTKGERKEKHHYPRRGGREAAPLKRGEGKSTSTQRLRGRLHHPKEGGGQAARPNRREGKIHPKERKEGSSTQQERGTLFPPFGLWCVLSLAAFPSSFLTVLPSYASFGVSTQLLFF